MGINATRSHVLSFSFLSIRTDNTTGIFNYKRFLEKSLTAAAAAKLIMEEFDKSALEETFVTALLQDIGVLILASTFPSQYEQVMTLLSNGQINIMELEQLNIGIDHALLGYEIAKNWGFPDELSIPIKYHHNPVNFDGNDKKLSRITKIVYLAGLISSIFYYNAPTEPNIYYNNFLKESKSLLGLTENIIGKILEKLDSEVKQIGKFFDLEIENPKTIEELLLEANNALVTINITYDHLLKNTIWQKYN